MVTAFLYRYGYYYDSTYGLVLIGVILSMIASLKVKLTFAKYNKQQSASNITGAMAAQMLLNAAGIQGVGITHINGSLTDNYNPSTGMVSLSDSVYGSSSIAALGVAAHEIGHVIQHNEGYGPIKVRSALVPVANFGSSLSWILIVAGLIFGRFQFLLNLGILMFCLVVAFHVITLPVEFDASRRAVALLESSGILYGKELKGSKKVLKAAGFTYVASTLTAILQLVRLIILFGGRDRD